MVWDFYGVRHPEKTFPAKFPALENKNGTKQRYFFQRRKREMLGNHNNGIRRLEEENM